MENGEHAAGSHCAAAFLNLENRRRGDQRRHFQTEIFSSLALMKCAARVGCVGVCMCPELSTVTFSEDVR